MEQTKCIRIFADKRQISHCQKKIRDNSAAVAQLSQVLELAGNEVRLNILFLLEEESRLCPCDLSDILAISLPAVSQHLRKLKDGNVIESIREGQTIYYSLKEDYLEILRPFFKYIGSKPTSGKNQ